MEMQVLRKLTLCLHKRFQKSRRKINSHPKKTEMKKTLLVIIACLCLTLFACTKENVSPSDSAMPAQEMPYNQEQMLDYLGHMRVADSTVISSNTK
jgi:hypothetical protein